MLCLYGATVYSITFQDSNSEQPEMHMDKQEDQG